MKPLCVISCPIDCYSGYSARSRDVVKAIIELKGEEWDIKILPQRWGDTPWGFIDENLEKWGFLQSYILQQPQLPKQPEIWMQITIPNEFQPIGRYNIGITAGMESNLSPADWIEGINRMDLTLVSSNHAKNVFFNSRYDKIDQNTKQKVGEITVEKPIEVLFEGATDTYQLIEWI